MQNNFNFANIEISMNVDQIVPKVSPRFSLILYLTITLVVSFVKREFELEDVYDLNKQLLYR